MTTIKQLNHDLDCFSDHPAALRLREALVELASLRVLSEDYRKQIQEYHVRLFGMTCQNSLFTEIQGYCEDCEDSHNPMCHCQGER